MILMNSQFCAEGDPSPRLKNQDLIVDNSPVRQANYRIRRERLPASV
jgi:hypothetical protein